MILLDLIDIIRYKIVNQLNYILNCKDKKFKDLNIKDINS